MIKKVRPKNFLARMEKKYKERKKGQRRVVGLIGSSQDFRFFTKNRHRRLMEHGSRLARYPKDSMLTNE